MVAARLLEGLQVGCRQVAGLITVLGRDVAKVSALAGVLGQKKLPQRFLGCTVVALRLLEGLQAGCRQVAGGLR